MAESKKRGAKKLPEQMKPYQFKAKGNEPCVEKITFRVPTSIKERMEKFKAENGRLPWDELRAYLDKILPE